MTETNVSDTAEITEPTKEDAEQLANALAGDQGDNGQAATAETAEESKETSEETKESETVQVNAADYLNIKRQAGRVDNLQQDKTDLAKQLKQFRDDFAAKPEAEKKLNADEVVNKLASDESEKFLGDMVDKSAGNKMAALETRLEAAEERAAASEYDSKLEEISGDEYTELRPLMNELVEAVKEGVANGDPAAIEEAEMIRASPRYLKMIAKEFQAHKASDQSAAARKGRDQERTAATDIATSSGAAQTGDEDGLTDAQVKAGLENMMGLGG